jgi:predicted RNase H-like nuclease (RuvC/YqgF family)
MRLLWILIPLAAIALAGFAEWLKFKRHTASLGESNLELSASIDALKHEIEELRQEKTLLVQRIRNLETIVTSEAWDTLASDPELSRARIPELPDENVDDEEKVQRLARRLRG